MPSSRLAYLFNRYVDQKCSLEEEKELMALLTQAENEAEVQILIDKFIKDEELEVKMPDHIAASILQNILQKDQTTPVIPLKHTKRGFISWMRVAAAIVLLIGGIAYWLLSKGNKNNINLNEVSVTEKPLQVLPGGNHATLTLANGSTIVLDTIQNGKIQYDAAQINKQNSVLIFDASTSHHSSLDIAYNTLSTPRGGNYQLILPDDSKVWLNASSSLQFPSAFTGNQREVKLTGEAYFEVAKNKKKPFKVKVDEMEIKVLGTHFNIKAYNDEGAIKTSLLEGSVKITKGNKTHLLKPGQQEVLDKQEDRAVIKEVDVNQVVAWKNGLFQFEGADITTIMKEIGRWYDVDIVYSGKVPKRQFQGKISRNAPLSDVLRILELSNVKLTMVGRKIIVG